MRPEPAPKQDRGASAAAGRKLRIEIRGPRNNVDLAFPMQAVAALTSLTAAVPPRSRPTPLASGRPLGIIR